VTDKSLPSQKPQSTSHRSSHQHSRQHQPFEDDDEQDVGDDEEDEGEMDTEEVKIAEQIGTFDEIVIWEHGGVVDKERDGYVRGLEEWVGWAGCMHGDEDEEGKGGEGKK
jgi:ribonuclease H2 subunit C